MTDQSDRELLEAAARAGGLDIEWGTYLDCGSHILYRVKRTQDYWNPLADDGDAQRLAVDGNIELEFGAGFVNAGSSMNDGEWHLARVEFNGDKRAAARRAIVRAAGGALRVPIL